MTTPTTQEYVDSALNKVQTFAESVKFSLDKLIQDSENTKAVLAKADILQQDLETRLKQESDRFAKEVGDNMNKSADRDK